MSEDILTRQMRQKEVKMKIGVLTVYNVSNFGSFLQAYALKRWLEKRGHEVYHIKVKTDREVQRGFYKYPATRRSLTHPVEEFQKYRFGKVKYRYFMEALGDFREIQRAEAGKLDGILIGSDELWNISEEEFQDPAYFGAGLPHSGVYGISVGRAGEKNFEEMPEYREYIRNLKFLTVRDRHTQELVQKITGKNPPMVCDPTFLTGPGILTKPCMDPYLSKHRYLLLYTYNFTIQNWTRDYVIRYAREKNLKLVSVGFYFSWCDYNVNCGPLEFSDVIRQAQCMVTTTFHGSVMGVMNHKKLLAVPFSQKVGDLLRKLGMEDAVMETQMSYPEFRDRLDTFVPDYAESDRRIERMGRESAEILDTYLKQLETEKDRYPEKGWTNE